MFIKKRWWEGSGVHVPFSQSDPRVGCCGQQHRHGLR